MLKTTKGQSYPHLRNNPSSSYTSTICYFSKICKVWASFTKTDFAFRLVLWRDSTSSISPTARPAHERLSAVRVTVGWKDSISKAWWVQPGTMCRGMRQGRVQRFPPCNFQLRETLTQAVACSRCVTVSDERGPQTYIKRAAQAFGSLQLTHPPQTLRGDKGKYHGNDFCRK